MKIRLSEISRLWPIAKRRMANTIISWLQKLLLTEYYKKDVVIVCSSNGWAGVIDYEEKKVLWQWSFGGGNFHPNTTLTLQNVILSQNASTDSVIASIACHAQRAASTIHNMTLFSE